MKPLAIRNWETRAPSSYRPKFLQFHVLGEILGSTPVGNILDSQLENTCTKLLQILHFPQFHNKVGRKTFGMKFHSYTRQEFGYSMELFPMAGCHS